MDKNLFILNNALNVLPWRLYKNKFHIIMRS